jgi:prevent-host-death family protein
VRRKYMPQIIPIKDLKNTSEISELCHKTNEPVYITKNGYGDMVIMSMETYERVADRLKMYQSLMVSEQQIKEGKVKDAKESVASVREKYGL